MARARPIGSKCARKEMPPLSLCRFQHTSRAVKERAFILHFLILNLRCHEPRTIIYLSLWRSRSTAFIRFVTYPRTHSAYRPDKKSLSAEFPSLLAALASLGFPPSETIPAARSAAELRLEMISLLRARAAFRF